MSRRSGAIGLMAFAFLCGGSVARGQNAPSPPDPAPAPNAESDEARRLYDEGATHYNLAEYDRAIDAFKRAYVVARAPELLYDIAQAYRQKGGPGSCTQALSFYRSYLRERPDAPDRARIGVLVNDMERCRDAEAARAAPPAASKPHVPPTPRREPPPSPPIWHRVVGIGALGAGVGLAGAAAFFAIRGGEAADDLRTGGWDADVDAEGRAHNVRAGVLAACGGAAIVAGALVLYVGERGRSAPPSSSVSAEVAPTSTMVRWAHAF